MGQNSYGQEILIENEVQRRMTLQVERQQRMTLNARADEDSKALKAFMEFQSTYVIDY